MGKKILVGAIVVIVVFLFLYFASVHEDFPVRIDILGLTPSKEPEIVPNCKENITCFVSAMSNNCERINFILPYPGLSENETRYLTGKIEGSEGEACKVSISDPQSGGTMICTLSGRLMKFINSFDMLRNYCQGSLLEQIMADVGK